MNIRMLKFVCVVAALAAIAYGATVQTGKAQNPDNSDGAGRVVIVDVDRLLSESKAAENIHEQLKAEQDKLQDQLGDKDEELKESREQLVAEQETLDEESFLAKRKEFQEEIMAARQDVSLERDKIQQAAAKAVQQLRGEIIKIVADMAEEQNFALVMTKQNIMLAEKTMEITDEVMERLNKDVTAIKLEVE